MFVRPNIGTAPQDEVAWNGDGLVPAIIQDRTSGEVLMMAWMNRESLRMTLESREAVFWSRSRREIWRKGATSGNVMNVAELRLDCDGDTLLLLVDPEGPACHTGAVSCFFRAVEASADRTGRP